MTEPIELLDLDDLATSLVACSATLHRSAISVSSDLLTKAAALLQSIVDNHALVDGSKRLGWLATAVFLELNGVKASRASNDDVYELVIWIAATNPDLGEITTRLRHVVQPRRRRDQETHVKPLSTAVGRYAVWTWKESSASAGMPSVPSSSFTRGSRLSYIACTTTRVATPRRCAASAGRSTSCSVTAHPLRRIPTYRGACE